MISLFFSRGLKHQTRAARASSNSLKFLRSAGATPSYGGISRLHSRSALCMSSNEDLSAKIAAQGSIVRDLKANKAPKDDVKTAVDVLLSLKVDLAKAEGTGADIAPVMAKEKAPAVISESLKADLALPKVDYFSVQSNQDIEYGDYGTIMSQGKSGRNLVRVKELGTSDGPKEGEVIWLRGRVSSVRAKGNTCFVVIRSESFYSVQACHFKDKENPDVSKKMINFIENIALESIVDICGVVAPANVKSCSQGNVEIQIKKIFAVNRAATVLPFLLEDASRSQEEIDASQGTDRPFAGVSQDARLNTRWVDLRVPANNAIIRIRAGIQMLFREALTKQGFIEINSPKLIGGESEGGSNAFHTDYFGQKACLAQSPQLYKQMAISSDFPRVFEVGPVFRAENSNTRRHLCEFTGLDLEMAITEHYDETLHVAHNMFKHIFNGLEERYSKELAVIRQQYHSEPVQFTDEPCIVHWDDGMNMLKEAGEEVDVMDDLTGALELKLGELVKEKFGTDFFMLDQYPSSIRPFYTMPSPRDPLFSNSYDMFIRGQEICSGAQRYVISEQCYVHV